MVIGYILESFQFSPSFLPLNSRLFILLCLYLELLGVGIKEYTSQFPMNIKCIN